jgi:hypothetical protein
MLVPRAEEKGGGWRGPREGPALDLNVIQLTLSIFHW